MECLRVKYLTGIHEIGEKQNAGFIEQTKGLCRPQEEALEIRGCRSRVLEVTQTTRVGRALCSRKLSPKFLGPYQISRRIGPVAYEIALPPQLANFHLVFHVS